MGMSPDPEFVGESPAVRPPAVVSVPAHPRDLVIDVAVGELLAFTGDWKFRHGLTSVEYVFLLHRLIGIHLNMMAAAERERGDETHAGQTGG